MSIFDDSLIHRYSFDGSGTNVVDSIGFAHGTVINTMLGGSGQLALAGQSSDQYVDLPDGLISALTSVTIEIWATWQGGAAKQRVFDFGMNSAGVGSNSGTGTSYFYLTPFNSNGTDDVMGVVMNFTPEANDATEYQIQAPPLSAGTQHHIVVTFRDPGASSNKTLRLYLDRQLLGESSIPANGAGSDNRLRTIDDKNVWIGRANFDRPDFAGAIDELRIWSRDLTQAEVEYTYDAGPDP
jgi:hypothetical protein